MAIAAWGLAARPAAGNEPLAGDMLSEPSLSELIPRDRPFPLAPRLAFAEDLNAVEALGGKHRDPAASHAWLAVLHDTDYETMPVRMPAVPHWAEQFELRSSLSSDRTGRFGFLNEQPRVRLALQDSQAAAEQDGIAGDRLATGYEPPRWGRAISAQSVRVAMPAPATYEPLATYSVRSRPLAPSGTMYLWSTSAEAHAAHGHTPAGASAGVVLTRPPGDYSVDWLGVAVTAPIQWR